MSSAGRLSGPYIAPTTTHAEGARQTDSAIGAMPELHGQVRRTIGVVREVHPEKPRFIKVSDFDGAPLANGGWIELNHSAQDIAERWGTVRVGFKVRVTYRGPSGGGADATIVNVENQDVKEPPVLNEVERGLFAIFCPGIGVG